MLCCFSIHNHGGRLRALLVSVISLAVISGHADTCYVSAHGSQTSPYDTWSKAGTNLKTVVDFANTRNQGDLVVVSNGLYTLAAQVTVLNTIVTNFSSDADDTIVNGNGAVRCFYLNHSNAVVDGLTISNGYVSGSSENGGGVWINNGGALRRCSVRNNLITSSKGHGGGVFIADGGMVTGCLIQANEARVTGLGGGGVCIQSNGLVTDSVINGNICTNNLYTRGGGVLLMTNGCSVVRCTISGNTGQQGGGIQVYGGGLVQDCVISNNLTVMYSIDPIYACGAGLHVTINGTIERSTIVNNNANAGYSGGGIYVLSKVTIDRCIIANNSANGSQGGGAVFFANGNAYGGIYADASIRNSLITGNSGTYGGGVYVKAGGGQVIENCTIVSNRATRAGDGGGGIYYVAGSTGQVLNSIVYFNRDNGVKSNWHNTGVLTVTNCCTAPTNGLSGLNNIASDPQFIGPDTADYRLRKGSPCVNAGLLRAWMNTAMDLDNRQRVRNGLVDIGAYEWLPAGILVKFR